MEEQQDENQGNSNGNKDSQPENESTSIASVTSMDCSSSIASTPKEVKAKDSQKDTISDLVAKSKKAAFSLWTLLHAKVC